METQWKKGSELDDSVQRECLNRFVHRFTRDHKPEWAEKPWKDGLPYPVQFDSDSDWLAHTLFAVNKNGRLNERHCECSPTWPDNPELRKGK